MIRALNKLKNNQRGSVNKKLAVFAMIVLGTVFTLVLSVTTSLFDKKVQTEQSVLAEIENTLNTNASAAGIDITTYENNTIPTISYDKELESVITSK